MPSDDSDDDLKRHVQAAQKRKQRLSLTLLQRGHDETLLRSRRCSSQSNTGSPLQSAASAQRDTTFQPVVSESAMEDIGPSSLVLGNRKRRRSSRVEADVELALTHRTCLMQSVLANSSLSLLGHESPEQVSADHAKPMQQINGAPDCLGTPRMHDSTEAAASGSILRKGRVFLSDSDSDDSDGERSTFDSSKVTSRTTIAFSKRGGSTTSAKSKSMQQLHAHAASYRVSSRRTRSTVAAVTQQVPSKCLVECSLEERVKMLEAALRVLQETVNRQARLIDREREEREGVASQLLDCQSQLRQLNGKKPVMSGANHSSHMQLRQYTRENDGIDKTSKKSDTGIKGAPGKRSVLSPRINLLL